ncbi:MAG: ATP-binding protein [Bacteroidales bacterium]
MKTIAVASGKGGTGKTFISTNLYRLMLDKNINVALADVDVEEPNSLLFFKEAKEEKNKIVDEFRPDIQTDKCTFCGKCAEWCNYNAIMVIPGMKKITLIDDLCHGCHACEFACKYGAILPSKTDIGKITSFRNNGKINLFEGKMIISKSSATPVIKETISIAKNHDDYEYLILDSPPGTSCPFIQTSVRADYVILVAEPTPFGISDLRQSIDTLKDLKIAYGVVINKCDIGDNKLKEYLAEENVEIISEIPFSKNIAHDYSVGNIASNTDTVREYFTNIINKLKTL